MKLRAAVLIAAATQVASAQDFHVEGLRTEYAVNPVGIDARTPRLSWRLHATRRGTTQGAYEIQVALDSGAMNRPLWTSGRVASPASILRPYGGPPLQSSTRYYWRVRAWDDAGRASPWSTIAFFETALLDTAEWRARWITPDLTEDTTKSNPSPMLRHEFRLGPPGVRPSEVTLTGSPRIASARLYVTSLGLNEVEINGRRVGDAYLRPGWTAYDSRLQYDTYDVTALVRSGANVIGATLGDGWFRGRLGWDSKRNLYGSRLALRAQLVVRYADGTSQTVTTDSTWKASTGPILVSDIYDGETYDARLEKTGWSSPSYNDTSWRGVRNMDGVKVALIAPVGPPVRRMHEITPVKVIRTPAGETVVDFGQNMVGWVRLKARGPAGTVIRLRHAESLDKAGNFYVTNLRTARQTVTYTMKGGGVETFEPHFTFQGFRYVAVEGYPGTPDSTSLTGIVAYSDMTPTGTFESSNALVNRLQQNIVWGQRGNFVDVPTDCPQRDERMGWTGDAQVFAPTATFNMDVSGFFAKWLGDVAADQLPNGAVPFVVPNVLAKMSPDAAGSTGWADVATIAPWTMYRAYGDTSFLVRQYASMRAWVEYGRAQAGETYIWSKGFHFGDWLSFATTRADYPGATTEKDLIATAYLAHSADIVSRAAEVLGKREDAAKYRALFEKVRAAFQREFLTQSGRITSSTQTAYVLALDFDLVPDSLRAKAAGHLADDVKRMGHLTTGFLGTPALTRMLSDNGYLKEAYALLLREEYPSWLYEVKQGATTVWERWDGLRPDSSFQDAGMNSLNHYAYGAVGDWLYRTVAGLNDDPAEPGYRHVIVRPRPGPGFNFAKATLMTPYGLASSGWRLENGRMTVTVRVPPNAHGTVVLPGARLESVREGATAVQAAAGVRSARQQGDDVTVEVGSGDYEFTYLS
jgi:alpha-L-rhamnosidase